jgi:hypothetical protein
MGVVVYMSDLMGMVKAIALLGNRVAELELLVEQLGRRPVPEEQAAKEGGLPEGSPPDRPRTPVGARERPDPRPKEFRNRLWGPPE